MRGSSGERMARCGACESDMKSKVHGVARKPQRGGPETTYPEQTMIYSGQQGGPRFRGLDRWGKQPGGIRGCVKPNPPPTATTGPPTARTMFRPVETENNAISPVLPLPPQTSRLPSHSYRALVLGGVFKYSCAEQAYGHPKIGQMTSRQSLAVHYHRRNPG